MDQRAWTTWNIANLGLRDTTHFKFPEQYSEGISDKRATRLNSTTTTTDAPEQLYWDAITSASGEIPIRSWAEEASAVIYHTSPRRPGSATATVQSRQLPDEAGRLRDSQTTQATGSQA